MGWAAGSELGSSIWDEIRGYIPEGKRQEVAQFIYDSVCDLDADDWDGTSQLEIDAGIEQECWNCGESFPCDELEDGMCEDCIEEDEDGE